MICEKHCIYLRAHSKNTGHMKMTPEFVKAKGKKNTCWVKILHGQPCNFLLMIQSIHLMSIQYNNTRSNYSIASYL